MKSYRIALVLLSGAMMGSALAAPATGSAAAAVLEGKQRLAEIRSRGEVLSGSIAVAMDEFVRLFNSANSSDQFDVQCGPMELDASAMEIFRRCEPRYIAGWYSRRKGFESPEIIDMGGNPEAVFPSTGLVFGGSYVRRAAGAPAPYKGEENAANFTRVVSGEPRLWEQLETINALYGQMKLLQGQYAQAKQEILASRIRLLVKTNVGPRVR